MQWDLLANPGAPAQPYVLDSSGAKKLLEAAAAEAEKVGLTWRKQPLVLKPSAELLKLARLSQQQAVKEGTAEES
jgi:hypothetical protein